MGLYSRPISETDNLLNAKDDIYTLTTLDIAEEETSTLDIAEEETRKIVIDALEQEDDIRGVKDLGDGVRFTWET